MTCIKGLIDKDIELTRGVTTGKRCEYSIYLSSVCGKVRGSVRVWTRPRERSLVKLITVRILSDFSLPANAAP